MFYQGGATPKLVVLDAIRKHPEKTNERPSMMSLPSMPKL